MGATFTARSSFYRRLVENQPQQPGNPDCTIGDSQEFSSSKAGDKHEQVHVLAKRKIC